MAKSSTTYEAPCVNWAGGYAKAVDGGEVDDDVARTVLLPDDKQVIFFSQVPFDRLRESIDATSVTNFCNNRCLVSMLNDKFAKRPPGGASKNAFFKLCIAIYNLLCN